MTKASWLDSALRLLKEAKTELENGDIKGAKVSVAHALGHLGNLKTQFEENQFIANPNYDPTEQLKKKLEEG